ncbi:gp53-like domain-containing protein [Salmonella enterica]
MANLTTDDSYTVFSLPKPFPTAFVSLSATPATASRWVDNDSISAHGYTASLAQIGLGLSNPDDWSRTVYGVYWVAIGY